MNQYQYLTEQEAKVVENFPKLKQEDLDQANDLFKHYIFYRTEKNGDRTLTTSCCHRHERYEGLRRLEDSEHHDFMCSSHNDHVKCPYCGKSATLKNIGKSGKRKSLYETHHIVFLHAAGESLFAQAYWVRKSYEHLLTGEAGYSLDTLYQFELGRARMFTRPYNEWHCQTEQGRISKMKIYEPFQHGCMYYAGREHYHLIGIDHMEESSLRYCQYSRWGTYNYGSMHSDFIKYMTLYSVYSKQVEMLMKAGAKKFIEDFLYQRKKNAYVFCWEQENPVKAFGLTKPELKTFLAGSKNPEILHYVKKLQKHGIRQSITEMEMLYSQLGWHMLEALVPRCLVAGIRPQKIVAYLDQFTGGCHAGGYRSIHDIFRHWKDYMDAAKAIGYDLTQERVTLPRDLHHAHDTATGEHQRRLQEARDRENAVRNAALRAELEKKQEAYEKRRAKLQKKYSMISAGLFVRVPKNADEIIAEGQALQHCVAGYAGRHMNGTLDILFLRRVDDPDKPLCTIEMNGTNLVQIHGFKNEGIHSAKGRFAPSK